MLFNNNMSDGENDLNIFSYILDDISDNISNNIEEKEFIPCPEPGIIPVTEAKAIVAKCVICHTNQIETVNFPCMHACFCIECASPALGHSEKCPQCRTICMHVAMLYLMHTYATSEDLIVNKKRKID